MSAIHNQTIGYRPEIDGLRAIAVLPVILFHSGLGFFSGGFVGVDVFFVISGYLITSIILRELEQGRFSIVRFYARRARRILPALLFVVLCTLPFAWMWMLPDELARFGKSLLAIATFSSNIFFLRNTNYFAPTAEDQPFLHTWSLAVEEQYYVLFPLFLILSWRFGKSKLFWLTSFGAILSLALAEWGWRNHPVANFYLLPMRAWELLAGSLLALAPTKKISTLRKCSLTSEIGAMTGLILILLSAIAFDKSNPFPSLDALIPVGGALLVITFSGPQNLSGKLLGSRPFVTLGLISYSAYLWHQPLLALVRIKTGDISANEASIFLALTLLLAWLTWRFIETPFRLKGASVTEKYSDLKGALRYGTASLVALGTLGLSIKVSADILLDDSELQKYTISAKGNAGVFDSGLCIDGKGNFKADMCGDDGRPNKILLWGDSFAMHLAQPFQNMNGGLVQATMSSCFPDSAFTPFPDNINYDIEWAKRCNAFSKSVLKYAIESESIEYVIVSSTFVWPLKYQSYDGKDRGEISKNNFLEAIKSDIRKLRESGKRVVFVSPTPQSQSGDFLRCAKRRLYEKHRDAPASDDHQGFCKFALTYSKQVSDDSVSIFLREIAKHSDVQIFYIGQLTCGSDSLCSPFVDGTLIYYDWGHLTSAGIEAIESKFDFSTKVLAIAR